MFDLTPGERRGALLLLALCALAALNDLTRRPEPAPPPGALAATGADAAPSAGAAPSPAGVPEPGPGAGPEAAAVQRVDLNRASVPELDALPGIGPVIARRIVAHRSEHGPFRGVDELLAVQGIGPRVLARLRPRVTVNASRTAADSAVQNAMRPRR